MQDNFLPVTFRGIARDFVHGSLGDVDERGGPDVPKALVPGQGHFSGLWIDRLLELDHAGI